MTISPTRMDVMRKAEQIREQHIAKRDPVLLGTFDRFIENLSYVIAHDVWHTYANDQCVSISDLYNWWGNSMSTKEFAAMCTAYGIPDEIIGNNDVIGRDHFERTYKKEMDQLLGWITTP